MEPMTPIKKENFIISEGDLLNAGYWYHELLPCPFCGSNKIISGGVKNDRTGNIVYKVFCTGKDCTAMVHICLGGDETKDQARKLVVEMWNKRTP
ncbi:MAG TPA: Lar family restriction alleviation protein [Flavitalea sp.]|nr:Lar family restriction alleviation protein [Flavitalea sp.]